MGLRSGKGATVLKFKSLLPGIAAFNGANSVSVSRMQLDVIQVTIPANQTLGQKMYVFPGGSFNNVYGIYVIIIGDPFIGGALIVCSIANYTTSQCNVDIVTTASVAVDTTKNLFILVIGN